MLDQVARLSDEHLLFLGVIGGLVAISAAVIGTVMAVQFRKLRQQELDHGFKDELLLRGYSVEETVQLVTSRKPGWSHGIAHLAGQADHRLSQLGHWTMDHSRIALASGSRGAGQLWAGMKSFGHQIATHRGPWMAAASARLSGMAHWLSDRSEQLARKLGTSRP